MSRMTMSRHLLFPGNPFKIKLLFRIMFYIIVKELTLKIKQYEPTGNFIHRSMGRSAF